MAPEPAATAQPFEDVAFSSPPSASAWRSPDPFAMADASATFHASHHTSPGDDGPSLLDPLARNELWPPLRPLSADLSRARSRSASRPHRLPDPPACEPAPNALLPAAPPIVGPAPPFNHLSLPTSAPAPAAAPDMALLPSFLGSNPASPRQQHMHSSQLSPPLGGQPIMPRPLGLYSHPPPPGPLLAMARLGRQDMNEEISTVFLAGIPEDITNREFNNYFIFAHGFEASSLTFPTSASAEEPLPPGAAAPLPNQPRGRPDHIIGFAKFRTRADAVAAREYLNGRLVDPERGAVLKTEMAKKNLHVKPTRSLSPPAVPRAMSLGEVFFPPGEAVHSHRPALAGVSNLSSPLGATATLLPRNSFGEASALAAGPLLHSGTLSPVLPGAMALTGPLSNSNSRAPSPNFPPRWDCLASPSLLSPALDVPDPLADSMRSLRGQWHPQPFLRDIPLEPGRGLDAPDQNDH